MVFKMDLPSPDHFMSDMGHFSEATRQPADPFVKDPKM